jgi:hypothetical protein
MTAARLTDRAMYGPEFNPTTIPTSTHLFFDDQRGNILDVQTVANQSENDWNLQSTCCSPTRIELYDDTGKMTSFDCVSQKDQYIALKNNDTSFTEKFKEFLLRDPPKYIGQGITPTIIHKIIENETPQNKRTGLYFFDFDMLLSQFSGLNLNPTTVTKEWLEQYAKYLFSDHIGVEPPEGRLNLLKVMFEAIGPDRAYIITANPYAGKEYVESGRVLNPNPYLNVFIQLIQLLMPSFIPLHLVCSSGRNKSDRIREILEKLSAKGGARSKTKSKTKSKTRSKTRSKTKSMTRSNTRARSTRRKRRISS